jgi:EmrB/QacA subfamily drug resistance transporter
LTECPETINDTPWKIFTCVGLGVFMATLDGSVVAVALPSLREEWNVGLETLQWVLSIYMLVITGLLLAAGRLADLVGQKAVYLWGLAVFILGSGLCAGATSPALLISARAVQGAGGAMLMACAPAIITAVFPVAHRGRGLGYLGTVVGLGLTAGPPIGGFLIGIFGWRAIFLINLPIGVVSILYGIKELPPLCFTKPGQKFDWTGAFLFTATCALLLLGASGLRREGQTVLYFGLAGLSFAAFLVREKLAHNPLVNLGLFRNREFTAALAASLLTFSSGISVLLLIPFYLTEIKHLSTVEMGMALMVTPFLMMILASWAGGLSDRQGVRGLTTLGLTLRALSFAVFYFLAPDTSMAVILLALILMGLGNAIFMPPNTSSIMGSVPPPMLGVAGGLTAVSRNLGMSIGVAAGSAVFDLALVKAGGTTVGEAARANHPAFMAGWKAAMAMAFIFCVLSVLVSQLRGVEKEKKPA